MTPRLDHFLHQWAFYKKCLIAFFALNVFSVLLSAVLGFNYFVFKRDLGIQQNTSLDKIEKADLALNLLQTIQNELNSKPRIEIRGGEDEKRVLRLLQNWQDLKALTRSFDHIELNSDIASPLLPSVTTQKAFSEIAQQLHTARQNEIRFMKNQLVRHNDTTRLLIAVGCLTLIFGILLPLFVLYRLGRTLDRMRNEMQNAALEFVKSWSETKAGFGDEAFKNVEFWLQVLLLLGHQAGQLSGHPAAQIAGEFAHLLRVELQKKSVGKNAT